MITRPIFKLGRNDKQSAFILIFNEIFIFLLLFSNNLINLHGIEDNPPRAMVDFIKLIPPSVTNENMILGFKFYIILWYFLKFTH